MAAFEGFADGLFGGINSMLDVGRKINDLKIQKAWNDAADAYSAGLKPGQGGSGPSALPPLTSTGKDAGADPSGLTPDTSTGQTKSATAADQELNAPKSDRVEDDPRLNKPAKTPPTQAPNYLPEPPGLGTIYDTVSGYGPAMSAAARAGQTTKSATAADAGISALGSAPPVAQQGAPTEEPSGSVSFSFDRGLHPSAPGEQPLGSQIGAAFRGTVPIPGTGYGLSLQRGLHRTPQVQAPSAAPVPGAPIGPQSMLGGSVPAQPARYLVDLSEPGRFQIEPNSGGNLAAYQELVDRRRRSGVV